MIPTKTRKNLATILTKQGAVVRKTRSGYLAKSLLGKTVSWHSSTPSDSRRADKNLAADIRRAGFDLALV